MYAVPISSPSTSGCQVSQEKGRGAGRVKLKEVMHETVDLWYLSTVALGTCLGDARMDATLGLALIGLDLNCTVLDTRPVSIMHTLPTFSLHF